MTHQQATEIGTLYIVATPIGNREDITFRALEILKSVDLILAEDTRHSLQLLSILGIKNNISSLHAHNEHDKSEDIIQLLLQGQSIALISDAGTPLISDPGFPLVKKAREQAIPVVPIPGPCALITALCAAGIPCDSFLFVGFLPAKQQARKTKLETLKKEPYTLVFYESTHRIMNCLDDLISIYNSECELVLAKELTKTFERYVSGTIAHVKEWLLTKPEHVKGEFVVIIPPRTLNDSKDSNEELLSILLEELSLKQAVALAYKISKANKNELYETALKLRHN